MADYYTLEQLVLKVGISDGEIAELESRGLLRPKLKDGRRFFSSREAHQLQAALRLARKQKLTLEKAFAKVEDLRLCQVGTTGN